MTRNSSENRIQSSVANPSEPLVSVLTPVYNGEQYLSECIESVLGQSYTHFEYLIINNLSTDRSLEIAQSFARRDDRIRIIDNPEFLPVIDNLNGSLEHISQQSVYCKFVFADDWILPECLERMVELAEKHPAVGIVSAYRHREGFIGLDGLPIDRTVFSGKEICRDRLFGGPYLFGSPNSILFRTAVVRELDSLFSDPSIHSDTDACFEVLKTWDFGFVHQVLTCTRQHKATVTTTVAQRLSTLQVAYVLFLVRHGRDFLSDDEYQKTLSTTLRAYYRFLGTQALQFRKKEFWQYHRNELERAGFKLEPRLVLWGAIESIFFLLTCQKDLSLFIQRKFTQKRPQSPVRQVPFGEGKNVT